MQSSHLLKLACYAAVSLGGDVHSSSALKVDY